MRQIKKEKGFSLVELLVVISVIATLTAVLLPNLMGSRERAKDAQKIQDLSSLKNALRLYYNDHQAYPTPLMGNTLGTGIEGYMPGATNLGYTYEYTQPAPAGVDGFRIMVGLNVGQGDEDLDSQRKCGVASPTEKTYAICAQ